MAILKRNNGYYQARVEGPDGRMLTKVFHNQRDAENQELIWKQQKQIGQLSPSWTAKITVDDYFLQWFAAVQYQASPGWRKCQQQFYRDYIKPVVGHRKIMAVKPQLISEVLNRMASEKKSEQSQLHVFNLMRKMFRDAVEVFQYIGQSPVLPILAPRVPEKEARYLSMEQATRLLDHVRGKDYDAAVWLQLYLGLRVSEVIALRWEDVDLDQGTALIARSYSRKDTWATGEKTFRDRPKGGKQHRKLLPPELWEFLKPRKGTALSSFVATSPSGEMLSYEFYLETLKIYC